MTQGDARVESSTQGDSGLEDDRISLFELGSVLILKRFQIAVWALLGAMIAVSPLLFQDPQFVARATFISKGADNGSTSGLRSIAGQFGISIPGAGGASPLQSPVFLAELVSSRMILGAIVGDTLEVPEKRGARVAILDLLDIPGQEATLRRHAGMKKLASQVVLQTSKQTGTLTLLVRTPWPSVSLHIASRVLEELNRFNVRIGQTDATVERRFIETRIEEQRKTLAVAESRLGVFLRLNRQLGNSPELTFEHDRLAREVSLQMQVLVGLAQSNEEARIRAVRDVPVLTVIEPPTEPLRPEPRGRLYRAFLGAVTGGVVALLLVLTGELVARSRKNGGADAMQFFELLRRAAPMRRSVTPIPSGKASQR